MDTTTTISLVFGVFGSIEALVVVLRKQYKATVNCIINVRWQWIFGTRRFLYLKSNMNIYQEKIKDVAQAPRPKGAQYICDVWS
jgi:hypothetical protein